MRGSGTERQAAVAGIASMALLAVGGLLAGRPPRFAASAATVFGYYHDHHRAALAGMILAGLAVPLYLWFVAHLALALRGPQGATIALGGLLAAACLATGDALTAAGTKAATTGASAESVRTLFQLSAIASSRLFWAGLAVAVPLALAAARGALRPWVTWVAWPQAAACVLGGSSLRSAGFFSPTGGMALVGYLAFFAGTAAVAVALWQSAERATAPAAATTAA